MRNKKKKRVSSSYIVSSEPPNTEMKRIEDIRE